MSSITTMFSRFSPARRVRALIALLGALLLLPLAAVLSAPAYAAAAAEVSGGVIDVHGEPVAGAQVELRDAATSAVLTSRVTDAEGTFALSAEPGSYHLRATKPGWTTGWLGWADEPSLVEVDDEGQVWVDGEEAEGNDVGQIEISDQTPRTVSGTVRASSGDTPLSGIRVTAYPTDEHDTVVASADTAADGGFALTVPDGTYDVRFVDPSGDHVATWYGGATPTEVVVAGAALTLPVVRMTLADDRTPHPVLGEVVDITGAGVDGLTVTATPEPGTPADQRSSTTTGADGDLGEHGRYRLALRPGDYLIDVAGGAAWADTAYTGDGESPATVTVRRDGTVLVDGVEAAGGDLGATEVAGTVRHRLSGTVTDGSVGLPGITVTAYAEDDPATAVASTTTGTGGAWTLDDERGLLVGSYLIAFSGTSGGATYDRAYFGGGTGTPVTIVQGGGAQVDDRPLADNRLPAVALTRSSADTPHPVTGEVTDVNGDPLAGVTVTATGGPAADPATTGADGGYTLRLKPGSYSLTYALAGFVDSGYPGGGAAPTQVTVALDGTVRAGTSIVDVLDTVALDDAVGDATLSGRVVSGGSPVSGIAVEVFPEGDVSESTRVASATTTATGTWSVSTLRIGTYTIRFTDKVADDTTYVQTYYGGADVASAAAVKVGQGNVVSVDGAPKSGGALGDTAMTRAAAETEYPVVGTVVDANGDPIAGASVTPSDGPTRTAATTDREGGYALALRAGSYTLTYAAAGFTGTTYPGSGERTVTITVEANGTVRAGGTEAPGGELDEVTLEDAAGTAAISGRVATGGTGLAGITVTLFPEGDFLEPLATTTSGTDGAWSLQSLRIGTYSLRFSGASGGTTYVTTYFGGTTAATASPVKVGQGDVVSVDGARKDGGALGTTTMTAVTGATTYPVTGEVSDANDEPLAEVSVEAIAISGGATTTRTLSAEEGGYRLALTTGTYEIRYSRAGYVTAYLPDWEGKRARVVVAAGGKVTIDGDEVAGAELDQVILTGTTKHSVSGTILGAGDAPIAGITVTATPDHEGNPVGRATTAADGGVTLSLPVGTYQVRVNDERSGSPSPRYQQAYFGASSEARLRVSAAGLALVDPEGSERAVGGLGELRLAVADTGTRYALAGTTYDPDYEVLGEVRVTAIPVGGTAAGAGDTTTSDGAGRYTLQVQAGRYRLRYEKAGYATTFLTGDDPAVPLTVAVSGTGVITAPGYADFELPVDVQLLLPAAPFATPPKLSGKVKVGQTVTASLGTLKGVPLDKDMAMIEWFLDGRPADRYSGGGYGQRFTVPAAAATKRLTFRVTLEDPDMRRMPSVFSSAPVTVPKAPARVAGAVKKGKLNVTVKVPTLPKPTGTLVIKAGKKKVATVKLTAKSKGKAVVSLAKLKPGRHKLTITYSGTATVAKAKKVLKVRVTR